MRRFVLGCFVLAVCTFYLPQPAAAQIELSAGYTFLSNDQLAVNDDSLPWGFFFDTSYLLNDWVSIAGDLSANFNTGAEPSTSLVGVVPPLPTAEFQAFSFNRPEAGFCSPRIALCEVQTRTVTGVAGPRFHFGAGGARAFFHVLGGATRSLRKIAFFAHTSTNFTLQPGAGIDIDMTDSTALRLQGDYRRVFFGEPDQTGGGASLVSAGGEDYQDFSFSVGVVLRLGGNQ